MQYVGYYNGEFGPLEEIRIPILDRSIYFGDACYEACTFKNGRIFGLKDHINRFYRSLNFLDMNFEMSEEELVAIAQKCVDMNDAEEGLLNWQLSRGTGYRRFAYDKAAMKANLMMFSSAYVSPSPLETDYKLKSMPDTRHLICNIKTTNLINPVIYSEACYLDGCDEAILYRGDRVTECAHSNVIYLKDGALIVPPQDNLILPGITMNHTIMLAGKLGIPVVEKIFTLEELKAADEVIITSTGVHCIAGVELDHAPIGGKDPERLHKLQQAYLDLIAENTGRKAVLDEAHF